MSCAISRPRLPVIASRKQVTNRSRRGSAASSRIACQPASPHRSAVKARKVRAVSVSANSVPSSSQSSRHGRRHRVGKRGQQRRQAVRPAPGRARRAAHRGSSTGQSRASGTRRNEPERNGDHRYSSETMKRVQPSGLKGALARRPAAMTRPRWPRAGQRSIQPIRRFAAAPSGGSRNQAR